MERVIFADFLYQREDGLYQQVQDMYEFVQKLEGIQEDFNSEQSGSKKEMKLLMFLDACEHISRICRVLKQPQGHMLLLGVGGSGRQSLLKLSSFICSFKLF